jgi:hypothetical protein
MRLEYILGGNGSALVVAGVAMISACFRPTSPVFFLGLTLCIIGSAALILAPLAARHLRMDDAFEAGFRAGERKGRRIGRPTVVSLIPKEAPDARVPQTAVRPLAGHRAPARRAQAD